MSGAGQAKKKKKKKKKSPQVRLEPAHFICQSPKSNRNSWLVKPVPGTLQEGGASFQTTHWTLVIQAGQVESPATALFSGTERLLASGYFRAKLAQENLIKASPIPYTIVRATQFFEFVGGIAQEATKGQTVRVPSAMMQPIVSDDVAAVVAKVALEEPVNGMVETAGPDPIRQDELVRQYLQATGDPRTVVTDPNALYYNIALNDQSLTPGDNPILGPTHFKDWLAKQPKQSGAVPA